MDGGDVVADLPHAMLTDPPLYVREGVEDARIRALRERDLGALPVPQDLGATLLTLLGAPNIASKRAVYRRYDQTVQTNTVQAPGGDAAVVRLKGALGLKGAPGVQGASGEGSAGAPRPERAIAMATDGNGRYCYLDPRMGGRIAVAEAARNVSCTGATPLAATDCLNFGNPEKPAVYYQLQQAVEGMAEACAAAGGAGGQRQRLPLQRERRGAHLPHAHRRRAGPAGGRLPPLPQPLPGAGETIALLGETREEVGASEYLAQVHGLVAGRVPELDLEREAAVQRLVRGAIQAGLLRSAHDCADGGLAVALVESCSGPFGLPADDAAGAVPVIGARIDVPAEWREMRADAVLFGESQSRILVSLRPEHWEALVALARAEASPCTAWGRRAGSGWRCAPYLDVPLATALERHATALEIALRTPVNTAEGERRRR